MGSGKTAGTSGLLCCDVLSFIKDYWIIWYSLTATSFSVASLITW